MLKNYYIRHSLTKPSTKVKNYNTTNKLREKLDFLTLIVFIILVSLLANLVFDVITSMNTDTYTNTIVDLRLPRNN